MVSNTTFIFIILMGLQSVSASSVLIRNCYNLGSKFGILHGAEHCKKLMRDCFRDGVIHQPADESSLRNKFSEVLFYSECSMKFESGCISSCKTHTLHEQRLCRMWNEDNKPVAQNQCQQQLAVDYVTGQCEITCFKLTKLVEQQHLFGQSQVDFIEKQLQNFQPTVLMWLPE